MEQSNTTVNTPDLGVRITMKPLSSYARWTGTRLQLAQEKIIPADLSWPDGKATLKWQIGDTYYVMRVVKPGEDLYRISSWHLDGNHRQRLYDAKLKELKAIADGRGPGWEISITQSIEMRRDQAFQNFKRGLLGQKKRGRKVVGEVAQGGQ